MGIETRLGKVDVCRSSGLNQKHHTQHKHVSNPSSTLPSATFSLLCDVRKTTSIPSVARLDLVTLGLTLSDHILILIGIKGTAKKKGRYFALKENPSSSLRLPSKTYPHLMVLSGILQNPLL